MPELHRKYGPIVRIGPNHLALDGSIGWPQVYSHRTGKPEFSKFPKFLFKEDEISLLGAEKDVHRRQRRQLGYAFSDSALVEQEGIIMQYVSLLMKRMAEHAEAGKPLNVVKWLNFTTFDIIGDLTFSDTFGNLDGDAYHPLVLNFFRGIRGNALERIMNAYPLLRPYISIMGSEDLKMVKKSKDISDDKALVRMKLGEQPNGSTRKDFMTYMLRKTRDGEVGMTDTEIVVNSNVIIGAGSETTATAMSGFFFYMGKEPAVYMTLAEEIRSTFKSEEEITIRSTAQLPYLQACIDETLRVYPPAAETPPRISPGAEIDSKFVPKGVSNTFRDHMSLILSRP